MLQQLMALFGWVTLFFLVGFLTSRVSHRVIRWIAWGRKKRTAGAWFRLLPATHFVIGILAGAAVALALAFLQAWWVAEKTAPPFLSVMKTQVGVLCLAIGLVTGLVGAYRRVVWGNRILRIEAQHG
jgi:hypothetical protein